MDASANTATIGTYKIISGVLAFLFFAYSIVSFLDPNVITSPKSEKRTIQPRYLASGLLYLITALMLAYVTFY